jgi:hypothetical protein
MYPDYRLSKALGEDLIRHTRTIGDRRSHEHTSRELQGQGAKNAAPSRARPRERLWAAVTGIASSGGPRLAGRAIEKRSRGQ